MKNRDMFYQNTMQGYTNPGMIIPPSGYNVNTQYQAYGNPVPFVNPTMNNNYQVANANPNGNPNIINNDYYDGNDYENRVSKLERQVKNLDTRLSKLESSVTSETTDNFYMI